MKRQILIASMLLGAAVYLQAQVTTSQSTSKPASNVVVSNDAAITGGQTTYYRGATGSPTNVSVGQSFTIPTIGGISDYQMNALTFNLFSNSVTVSSASFQINIYQVASASTNPSPSTLISSQTGTLTASSLTVGDYLTFNLGTDVTLTSGDSYVAMFAFTSPTSADSSAKSLGFSVIPNAVGKGRKFVDSDGTYSSSNSGSEFEFFVQTADINEAPEPSNMLMLGLGGLVLLLVVRKKRKDVV